MKTLTLLLLFALSGCAQINPNNLHDTRLAQGCLVVTGQYAGTFATGTASACKLVCSPKLPKGYNYEYNSGGCNVSVKN